MGTLLWRIPESPKLGFVCLGFIDIFSESKEGLGVHASLILRFLHRNRLSGMAVPCPMLDHCNNMCSMRVSVLKESLDQLVQKEKGTCTCVVGAVGPRSVVISSRCAVSRPSSLPSLPKTRTAASL